MYYKFRDQDLKSRMSFCEKGVILSVNRSDIIDLEDETLIDESNPLSGGYTMIYAYQNDLNAMIDYHAKNKIKSEERQADTESAYNDFSIVHLGSEKVVMVLLRANAFREINHSKSTVTFLLPIVDIVNMDNSLCEQLNHDASVRFFDKLVTSSLNSYG